MRTASLLAVAAIALVMGCAPGIDELNARPDRYYQKKLTFTGRIARMQDFPEEKLLEVADARDHRILVRVTGPIEATTGDWVKVTGVLVPEARVGNSTVYDVVTAEEIKTTRPPRFRNLM
jgi:uncharacterized membrane protein YcgQ (UPF0703/DUF1980 family)